ANAAEPRAIGSGKAVDRNNRPRDHVPVRRRLERNHRLEVEIEERVLLEIPAGVEVELEGHAREVAHRILGLFRERVDVVHRLRLRRLGKRRCCGEREDDCCTGALAHITSRKNRSGRDCSWLWRRYLACVRKSQGNSAASPNRSARKHEAYLARMYIM